MSGAISDTMLQQESSRSSWNELERGGVVKRDEKEEETLDLIEGVLISTALCCAVLCCAFCVYGL